MSNLKDLFLDELAGLHDAEKRISKALSELARAATSKSLSKALLRHQEETNQHVEKIDQVFAAFDEDTRTKACHAAIGLIEEGEECVGNNQEESTLNAAIISACQKVELYEIASYGSLLEWARLMENHEAVGLLEDILDDEKAMNEILNRHSEAASLAALIEEDSTPVAKTAAMEPVNTL